MSLYGLGLIYFWTFIKDYPVFESKTRKFRLKKCQNRGTVWEQQHKCYSSTETSLLFPCLFPCAFPYLWSITSKIGKNEPSPDFSISTWNSTQIAVRSEVELGHPSGATNFTFCKPYLLVDQSNVQFLKCFYMFCIATLLEAFLS